MAARKCICCSKSDSMFWGTAPSYFLVSRMKTRLFPAHSVGGGVGAPYCEIKCNVLYAHYLPTKKVHRRKVGESHRYSVFVVDASWTIISSEP